MRFEAYFILANRLSHVLLHSCRDGSASAH